MPRAKAKKKVFNFWTFLRSGLRRLSIKYPPINEVLQEAKRPYSGPNKRQKFVYECACCHNLFAQKDIAIDHVIPCGSLSKREDVADFIMTLFCDKENLQVLCSSCHDRKTVMDKNKCSEQEAEIIQKVAAFRKLKAVDQQKTLTQMGIYETITPASKRIELYKSLIEKEKQNEID